MNKQNGFVSLIVVLVLVAVAGLGYFYLKSNNQVVVNNPPAKRLVPTTPIVAPITTPVNPPANPPVSTPENKSSAIETYLAMRAEFDKAQSFDDIVLLGKKYSTPTRVKFLISQQAQFAKLPPSFTQGMISSLKSFSPSVQNIDVANIKESVIGNIDTLIVSDKLGKFHGTVNMVNEAGVWKVDIEDWGSPTTNN